LIRKSRINLSPLIIITKQMMMEVILKEAKKISSECY
jgi:hypothetical protein